MSKTVHNALVIGGTGMLRHAVHELVGRGSRVIAVSRNPDRAAPPPTSPGEFFPVAASWEDPKSLVDAIAAATDEQRAELVVVWVHTPYRAPLMRDLERVVAPDAIVVQVWGSAGQDPREVLLAERVDLPGRTTRDVVLGYVVSEGRARWLTHTEISDGVLHTIDQPQTTRTVGQIDPWSQRP